jgi:hypothetical protein
MDFSGVVIRAAPQLQDFPAAPLQHPRLIGEAAIF